MTSNIVHTTTAAMAAYDALEALQGWKAVSGNGLPLANSRSQQRLDQFAVGGLVTGRSIDSLHFGALIIPPPAQYVGMAEGGWHLANWEDYRYTLESAWRKTTEADGDQVVMICHRFSADTSEYCGVEIFYLPYNGPIRFWNCLPQSSSPQMGLRVGRPAKIRPHGNVAGVNVRVARAIAGTDGRADVAATRRNGDMLTRIVDTA